MAVSLGWTILIVVGIVLAIAIILGAHWSYQGYKEIQDIKKRNS